MLRFCLADPKFRFQYFLAHPCHCVQQFYLDHPPQMRATERGKGRGWRLPELFRKRK